MQRLLDICQKWSFKYNIVFNLKKCFVLSKEKESNLILYNKRMQTAEFEKYLGVSTSNKGIAWTNFVKQRVEKATNLLNFCCLKENAWPEWIRLHVYNVFIQPQLDYIGPALHLVAKRISADASNSIDIFFDWALGWIFCVEKQYRNPCCSL